MRTKRRLALSVLLAAVVVAVASFPLRATWWGGWILAIAEAGIVGGLADWFAVTAIFRRPLGLPIPHTGLIQRNWELLASRVGTMVGDRVLTRNINPETHTRLPRYARGRTGVIECVRGFHVFPDTVAIGEGEQPQWLYTVLFEGRELWGESADPTLKVSIEAWEPYLESA